MFRLAFALACVTAVPAAGQPLFHCERDWTVEISGKRYGFRDVVQTPGGDRWTEVWVADNKFQPGIMTEDRWLLTVPPVAAVLAYRRLTLWPWRESRRR